MDLSTLLVAALFVIFVIAIAIGIIIAVIFALFAIFPFLLPLLPPLAAIYYKIFGKKEGSKSRHYSVEMGEESHKKGRE